MYNFINRAINEKKILLVNENEVTIIEKILHQQFQDHLYNSDFDNSISHYKKIVNNWLEKIKTVPKKSNFLLIEEKIAQKSALKQ